MQSLCYSTPSAFLFSHHFFGPILLSLSNIGHYFLQEEMLCRLPVSWLKAPVFIALNGGRLAGHSHYLLFMFDYDNEFITLLIYGKIGITCRFSKFNVAKTLPNIFCSKLFFCEFWHQFMLLTNTTPWYRCWWELLSVQNGGSYPYHTIAVLHHNMLLKLFWGITCSTKEDWYINRCGIKINCTNNLWNRLNRQCVSS